MFLVGLTGGIATGKSTVSGMLTELGCPLIDADLIAREVVEPGRPAWKRIRREFGPEMFHEDGTLNRAALATIIFSDESKRKLLNSITHPQIHKTMLKQLLGHFIGGEQLVVLDVPLLMESASMLRYMTFVLVVYCDEKTQLERLQLRNGFTEAEARRRIDAQIPVARKRENATHVIDNSADLEHTRRQVRDIHAELRRSKKHWRIRLLLGGVAVSLIGLVVCQFYL